MANTFLPQNGSYRELRVYKITEIIYDYTYFFVQHYKEKGDRTIDQMVQAARSGKQNIAEGNQAAATSSETEIKLANLCITLIHQAMYMLYKLLEHQQERFVTQGGIREQMLHARLNYRGKKSE